MAKKSKEIIQLLFPEYQIKACVDERGFIAKKQQSTNYAQKSTQTFNKGNVQQQSAPASAPLQQVSRTSTSSVAPMQSVSTSVKTHTPSKEETKAVSRAVDAFDGLSNELKKYWVGSDNDRNSLCKAFQRPYVKGFDNTKPKNAILVLGAESRGKVYAVRCITELLKEKKVFRYAPIATIDMVDYVADSSNALFLSDLFKALNTNTETVVFENIDKASLGQLDIIYQLLTEGTYKLSKRYMVNNGSLVEATGILNTELVSEIATNGKFFVMTSVLSQSKIISILGNKIVKELGDIITLDPIGEGQVKDLAYTLCVNLVAKCKKNLHIDIEFDNQIVEALSQKYNASQGVKGLENHIDDHLYETLSEMKLQEILWDDESAKLTYEDGYCVVLKGGEVIKTSSYLRNYNAMELEEARKELEQVIGLAKVKEYVLNLETNYKVQKMREGKGLKKSDISMHMIFVGNPGTGKTTIARIVAKYLKAIGVLTSGHLCEVTRADLVGQYAGHTAVKTTEVINSAVGGVLFIDEAYSLCRDKNDAFGLEAIDALVKGMEDNRDDLVVILAGYEDEMQEFLKANSGLKSRFPNVVHFEDYSVDEMCAIAKVTAASKGYKIDDGCIEGLIHQFEKHQIKGKNDGGNGRLVRNLIEAAVLNQSKRIINDVGADMELLLKEDFGFDKVVEFDLEKSLAEVIGMEEVKKFIRTQYTMLQANKRRKKANIDVDTTQSLNMIFAGNPGTGKTTMARIVADMFHSMDILKSGQLVEVDKGGLVAQYVGQTAKKTEEVFKSALGGVLFIDEAYSITNDGSSFGQECIDTLVKLIEDYRGEIVVILAGYSKEMKDFMKSNSGLESRFPLFVEFPDYSASELYQISLKMIHARGFRMDLDGQKAFENEIIDQKQYATENSGNGRMVRNLIDEIIRKQSVRVIEENVEHEETNLIKPVDIRGEDKLKNFDLEKELSGIIGLTSVKDFVRTQYRMCLATEKRRKADLKVDTTQSLNMIFAGNPGTGKTTIARVVAEMFKSMGILKKGQLIETDKTGLIAEYVGQTAKKTEDVFKSAIGGVLFIDEAYSITNDGSSFGQECIDTLVKLIEDHKGELIVILAGYSKEMNDFMKANSGLESRFPLRIDFPDYSASELYEICKQMIAGRGFSLAEGSDKLIEEEIQKLKRHATASSGNGRMVRNFVESVIRRQSSRIATEDISGNELTMILPVDIKAAETLVDGFDLEAELAKVIGLDSVKKYIRSLNARLKLQAERKKAGLKTDSTQTMHMIFAGNPGTGKTMMARTVANVLYNMNVIQSNKLIETDRSGLVAGYVGQTAIKTREVIETALGGVLFIDEAYALAQGGDNDFGQEAIDTLVKMMDDNRDRLVVILAGYSDDMNKFLDKNAGLHSRFANIIEFPDYSTDELMQIADGFYSEQGYVLSETGKVLLRQKLEVAKTNKQFGNGRYVRNVFERSLNNQALRLSNLTEYTKEALVTITEEDIKEA
jgi:SpoVK/Ycf46/Vps4 family AAA+-type ATPase